VKILAIETSGAVGGIALLDNDQLLSESFFEKGMVHGRELAPSIEQTTKTYGIPLSEIDLIAVDIGPGSFTGLRVGLATAKGLCLGLHKPILGVVSLDAMAEAARGKGDSLCPLLDAKWDQLYGAIFTAEGRSEIFSEKPEECVHKIPSGTTIFGTALEKYAELFRNYPTLGSEFAYPKPSEIGRIAARDYAAGRRDDISSLVPLYLRPTDAEIKFKR
jgi:tRNA threonylcarbamoyladenosine biosynthesis protein TsaB